MTVIISLNSINRADRVTVVGRNHTVVIRVGLNIQPVGCRTLLPRQLSNRTTQQQIVCGLLVGNNLFLFEHQQIKQP